MDETKALPGETTNVAAMHEKFTRWLADVTKGQKFEPVPIEVGREDGNPVEIQASWARIDGTHVTWNSPGEGPSTGLDPLGDAKKGGAVQLYFCRL